MTSSSSLTLRPYQQEAVKAVFDHWREWDREILCMMTGCHTPDQGILMYDGSVKRADEVVVGDRLMGPDGLPRNVLRLFDGTNLMYRVTPIKGSPFTVTQNHVLPLMTTPRASADSGRLYDCYKGGKIDLVNAGDYNGKPRSWRHVHKIFRAGAIESFSDNDGSRLTVDPYFLGAMLGDGSMKRSLNITTMDDEVYTEAILFTAVNKGKLSRTKSGRADTFHISRSKTAIDSFKKLGLWGCDSGDKFVPFAYKTAPIAQRLETIAGLIDADGSLTTGGYDFISKSETLANDLAFMCRSVGLAAYVKSCVKGYRTESVDFKATYWRVSISGDCSTIPCRVEHKIASKRRQKKSVLRTGVKSCECVGIGKYAGFEVDGDHLYLLGDFTVTHNTGKTRVAQAIAQDRLREGPVLFLAHREELLDQARRTFGWDTTGYVKAQTCDLKPITVASVQTLANRPAYDFSTVIVDEAHHAVAESYQKILARYPNAKVLGLTATPDRKGLGDVFDGIAYEYGLRRAVREGYLSPIVARTVPIDIDLTSVKVKVGDFELTSTANALRPYLPEIAKAIRTYASDRKTIVFTPLIAISQELVPMLLAEGFEAREVNGNSEDRAETTRWFRDGPKGIVAVNSMIWTEGADFPDCDCVVCLRPTKVRSLYVQIIGRALRLAPGKRNCLVLDFLWLTTKHDLCRPASLLSDKEEDVQAVADMAEQGELDIMDGLEDAVEQRKEALARALQAQRRKKARLVDPLTYFVQVRGDVDYEERFAWEREPASEKQQKMIEKAGIDPTGITRGRASRIIDSIVNRREQGLATPKQVRMLERKGFVDAGLWTFDQASKVMTMLARNHWRVPWGIDPATYRP